MSPTEDFTDGRTKPGAKLAITEFEFGDGTGDVLWLVVRVYLVHHQAEELTWSAWEAPDDDMAEMFEFDTEEEAKAKLTELVALGWSEA